MRRPADPGVARLTGPTGLAALAMAGLAAGLLVAGGCRREAPPPPDLVARVGLEEVSYAQFESYLDKHLGESSRGLASDVLSRMFDQFLAEKLLARLAVDRGLAPASAGRRAAIDRLLAAAQAAAGEPGGDQVAAYYRDHRDDFARPERVRLRQILVPDRATAEAALAELRAGADFAEVARRVSGSSAEPFGDPQGELARGELPPAFADIIFALRAGELSDVIEADYGFHLFQVTARLPAQVLTLTEARDEIVDRLRQEQADRLLDELAAEARNRYNVTVYERNLPFNYQGDYSAADPS